MTATLSSWIAATSREAAWAPTILFLLHVLASRVFNGYDYLPWLDKPMHYLGGVAIAFFFHRASVNASRFGVIGGFHRLTHLLLVFALVSTTTIFWEFAEFINDRFFGGQAQLGLEDTLLDMFLGIVGGLSFLVALWLLGRTYHTPSFSD